MTMRLCGVVLGSVLCACLSGPMPAEVDGGSPDAAINVDGPVADAMVVSDARVNDASANSPDAPWNDALIAPNTHFVSFAAASDHHLSVADQPGGVDVVDTMTFEAWIRLDALPSDGNRSAVVVKADFNSVDNSYGFEIRNIGGVIRFEARVEGTQAAAAAYDAVGWNWGALAPDTWYHIAVSYDITPVAVVDRFKFYKNGVEDVAKILLMDGQIDTIRNSGTPMIIGARIGTGVMINQFDGDIDEVRIWDTVRSEAQILANHDVELVGTETDLLGYWPLDNDLADATSGANDAVVMGTPPPVFDTDTPPF